MDYQFIQVKSFGKHRVSLRVANGSIHTIAHSFDYDFETSDPHQWFVLVDSSHFNETADTFRNLDIYQLEPSAEHLLATIKEHVDSFFAERYKRYQEFLKQLRADTFYPYRKHHASSETRSMVFNQLAFYLEEQHRLLTGKATIRELVYELLDKAMDNREFELLLSKAIKLDEDSLIRFKSLLEKADLEDVIAFSEEVCRKQQFLDLLHKLNYTEISKRVKERSELHKIIEKHLWVFSEQYNGTPRLFSDKNLEDNLKKLREKFFSYRLTEEDENIQEVEDEKVKHITDLFFFNESIVTDEEREILIVELKAPSVRISSKEINQATKYAIQIEEQGVFPKGHRYRIVLVGSTLNTVARAHCGLIDPKQPYLFFRSKCYNIEAWAIEWSDLIARNRKRLSYLGNALNTKDKDASAMIESEFKDVNLTRLKSELGKSESKPKTTKKEKRAA